MKYESELRFLQAAFGKCHVQTLLLNPLEPLNPRMDMGLYALAAGMEIQGCTFYDFVSPVQKNTIYRVTDSFFCCYIFFLLPGREETILFIGPYLEAKMTHGQVADCARRLGIPMRRVKELENYYGGLPVLRKENPLFAMLDAFGELIWRGSGNFAVVNLNQEHLETVSPLAAGEIPDDPRQAVWNMQALERRYAYENELMQAVSRGQVHKTERLLADLAALPLEKRLSDHLRNAKNYCIIMNTLLRKAAESGGVHPVYLDSVSSDFAKKIEALKTSAGATALMQEMFRFYCRLVSKHSIRKYSPPVQKAITYIDSDLTADLSLSALAAMQNVSAGYLSALFRQETGQTLTEHVNRKRIRYAMQLLKTTNLQIQTVAQYCGIVDVHYFSKLFRKYVGKPPTEYRESVKRGKHWD